MEMTFFPGTVSAEEGKEIKRKRIGEKRDKDASFGVGMRKGKGMEEEDGLKGELREGRTKKRMVGRSASRNKTRFL